MSVRIPLSNGADMKILIILILMGSSSFSYAKDNSKRVASLAQSICSKYGISGLKFAEEAKASIKWHIERHEDIQNPTGAQMLGFLNRNRHKMKCTVNGVTKNYMMYAFDMRFHGSLFDELFYDDLMEDAGENFYINVNAVSYTGQGSKPETVLDYMDNLIKTNKFGTSATSEIITLKEVFLEDLDAKYFSELPVSEQAKFRH
jgi:hypothetical protein